MGRSATGESPVRHQDVHGGVRAADKILTKMVADHEAGKLREGRETISDLMATWLEHCETKGLSPTTIREHRRSIEKNVLPVIGSIKLTKLRASDLDRLYAVMVARGVKATTVRRTHAVVSSALKQATRWGLLDTNPALRASPPAVYQAQVEAPSPDELASALGNALTT